MGRDTSILISARDQVSPAINSMRSAGQAFNKDLEETQRQIQALQTKQSALGDNYKKLQANLDDAKNSLQTARKEFKNLNDEASRTNLENAYGEYNRAKSELQEYGDEMKRVQKTIRDLSDEQSRAANRAGDSGVGAGDAGVGVMKSLASAGLGKMMGDSLSGATNIAIGSAFGDTMGSAISTTLSGALTGAGMGSIAGPIGTAVGAAVGTLSGGISAIAESFSKEDDAFKAVRNDMVQNALNEQSGVLQAGIPISDMRKRNHRAFETLLRDDDMTAEDFNQALIEIGRTPPFSYDLAVSMSRDMLGLGSTGEDALKKINGLADTAAALGLSDGDVSTIVSLLESSQASGKVEKRLLTTLGKKGINVYDAIASNLEVDGQEIGIQDVEKYLDTLSPEMFSDALFSYLESQFSGAAQGLSGLYSGLLGIVESYNEDLASAMGEGYNEVRMQGMEEQIEYLSGEGGAQLQEANRMIGEWKGALENNREQMEREIMAAVMSGDMSLLSIDLFDPDAAEEQIQRIGELAQEYLDIDESAEDAGARAGKILAQAQIEAQMAYNASDGAQLEIQMQKTLIDDVTSALVTDKTYWNAGYILGQSMSEGMMSAVRQTLADMDPTEIRQGSLDRLAEQGMRFDPTSGLPLISTGDGAGHAFGLARVPYDDYPARLHEGEMVLTAAQARQYMEDLTSPFPEVPQNLQPGSITLAGLSVGAQREHIGMPGSQVNVSGNQFTIREEADIYKIAQEIVAELMRAQMVAQ